MSSYVPFHFYKQIIDTLFAVSVSFNKTLREIKTELEQILQESPISLWNLKEVSDKFYIENLIKLGTANITRIDPDQKNKLGFDEGNHLDELTSLFGTLSFEEMNEKKYNRNVFC